MNTCKYLIAAPSGVTAQKLFVNYKSCPIGSGLATTGLRQSSGRSRGGTTSD